MKPKARQIVFLEYEQPGFVESPGFSSSRTGIGKILHFSTLLLKSMTLSVAKVKSIWHMRISPATRQTSSTEASRPVIIMML